MGSLDLDEMWSRAQVIRRAHDPGNQGHQKANYCILCAYQAPCAPFLMASDNQALIAEIRRLIRENSTEPQTVWLDLGDDLA
jgi:hypothetical protein